MGKELQNDYGPMNSYHNLNQNKMVRRLFCDILDFCSLIKGHTQVLYCDIKFQRKGHASWP